MQSIQEASQKIKVSLEIGVGEWGVGALILLIAIASFGLGRLSVFSEEKSEISITSARVIPPAMATGGEYEASKAGTTYYFPWCSGAESIQPQDQVWFKSESAAQKAGYSPAKNCKGLSS
jgi:hypothetical protein